MVLQSCSTLESIKRDGLWVFSFVNLHFSILKAGFTTAKLSPGVCLVYNMRHYTGLAWIRVYGVSSNILLLAV